MDKLKIALVPLQGLGDGVISLILANNLNNNHYSVTLFHGFMHDLNDWFDFIIKDYPPHEQLEAILDSYDMVLMDMCIPYTLSKSASEQELLSKKYIFYAVGCMQDEFIHDHSQRLIARLGENARPLIKHIAKGCRTIKYDNNDSMVDNMTHYCQRTLQLEQVSNESGIKIPELLQLGKFNKRVVIAPTSSLEKKNWGEKKFILLARLLKQQGYHPVFAVSVGEWPQWHQIIKEEFDLPKFNSIEIFARYLYESLGFIGNDSGGGHVASLVGIPVLTIVTSPRKLNFKWRPGWGSNAVVAPRFTFKIMGRRYWRPFLSVQKVINLFQKLTESR